MPLLGECCDCVRAGSAQRSSLHNQRHAGILSGALVPVFTHFNARTCARVSGAPPLPASASVFPCTYALMHVQGFAHVLKSMEPAFTALFSGLLTGKWQHPAVYATLVPVMGGVAYASASELNFNMLQFVAAMVRPFTDSCIYLWTLFPLSAILFAAARHVPASLRLSQFFLEFTLLRGGETARRDPCCPPALLPRGR